MISFVETKLFTRLVQEYLSDDEYSKLQEALLSDPEAGAVIRGSGGVRKLRWGVAGRGKRGGIRDAAMQNAGLFAFAIEHDRCRGPLGRGRARRH